MLKSTDFQKILDEWDLAEKAIKVSEQITGKVAIPSVMELRYAGRRICEAARLPDGEAEKARELLADARFDCIRAQHDAIDISVNFIAGFIDSVLTKSEPLALQGKYEAIASYLEKIEGMQKRIAESRKDRFKRTEIYNGLLFEIEEVRTDFSKFKVELIEIIEKSDEYYQSARSSRKLVIDEVVRSRKSRSRYTFLLASAATAGTVLVVLQRILGW